MSQTKSGFKEAIFGLVFGTIYNALQNSASNSGKFLFIAVGILCAIFTIKLVATGSIGFIIGWLFGSWLLKSLWGFLDYVAFVAVAAIGISVLLQKLTQTKSSK